MESRLASLCLRLGAATVKPSTHSLDRVVHPAWTHYTKLGSKLGVTLKVFFSKLLSW